MKASNFFKLAMATALVAASGLVMTNDTKAATGTIGSTVSVGVPVTVSGVSDLIWGVMAAPTAGSDLWVMSCGGVLSGGTAANDLFGADNFAGQFSIDGNPGASVTFSVAVTTDFADVNLSLHTPTMCTASPASLDGAGNMLVDVGGSLDIASTATAGDYTDAVITMTANY